MADSSVELPNLSMSRVPCGKPVALPIRSHKVPGLSSSKRGVSVQFGTPPQELVLQMNSLYGALVVSKAPVDEVNCPNDMTNKRCLWVRGGVFDTSKSSTFKGASNPAHAKDTLTLASGIKVNEFALELESRSTGGFHKNPIVGLHPHNALMGHLYSSKHIPSKAFSLDVGRNGRIESEGELLFGGYNKKRMKGSFEDMQELEATMEDAGCNYRVMVKRITAIMEDGERITMMDRKSSDAVVSCLEFTKPIITIPHDAFEILNNKIGRPYDVLKNTNRDRSDFYLWGYTVDSNINFKGSLEYEFTSGMKVLIPNDQLVTPSRHLDDDGNVVMETGKSTLLVNNLAGDNENDMPHLGLNFMASLYISVDARRGKFWLAHSAYAGPGDNDYAVLPGAEVAFCTVERKEESKPPVAAPTTTRTRRPESSKTTTLRTDGGEKPSPTRKADEKDDPEPSEETESEEADVGDSNPLDGSGEKSEDGWRFDEDTITVTDGDKISRDDLNIVQDGNVTDSNSSPGNRADAPDIKAAIGDSSGKNDTPTAMIGGLAGGIVFFALLATFLFFFYRRRRGRGRALVPSQASSEVESKCLGNCSHGPGSGHSSARNTYSSNHPQRSTIVYEIAPPDSRHEMATGGSTGGYYRNGTSLYEVPIWNAVAEIDSRAADHVQPGLTRATTVTGTFSSRYSNSSSPPTGKIRRYDTASLPPLPTPPDYNTIVNEPGQSRGQASNWSDSHHAVGELRRSPTMTSTLAKSTVGGTNGGYITVLIDDTITSDSTNSR